MLRFLLLLTLCGGNGNITGLMAQQEVEPRSPGYHGGDPDRTLNLREPELSTLRPVLEYDYSKENIGYRAMPPIRNCGTVEVEEQLKARGVKTESEESFEEWLEEEIEEMQQSTRSRRVAEEIYTLPIVVHVVYANSTENISDAQVFSQIEVLNQDYRRRNPDRNRTPRTFEDLAEDTQIEFCLASVDPNGNPTNGINRVSFSGSPFTEGYINNVIKPSTIWDPNRYFNIWVCYIADDILGFAQFPQSPVVEGIPGGSTAAQTDGVVINYRAFGTLGTVSAPFDRGRTATHEVGHWLGLRHIWGDGPCDTDDYCEDTPMTDGPHFNCPTSSLSCNGNPAMYSNFMDYTPDACMNLFTADQKLRMRRVIESSPRRKVLLTSNACQANLTPPEPDFIADVRSGCGPLKVQFTDRSEGDIEQYNWIFPEGRPGRSSDPNPQVTYRKPGIYPVTLQVSNGIDARSETREAYIEVLASGQPLPYNVDFDTDEFPPNGLRNYNISDDHAWQHTARVSGAGRSQGAMVINHYDNHLRGSLDWLVTPIMDFSQHREVMLSFKVSYALYAENYSDTLGIFIATDCGSTFRSIYYKGGEDLATYQNYAKPYTPTAEEWRTEAIDLSRWAGEEHVQIAIVSRSGYGNNLYLDDFTIKPIGPDAPEPDFVAKQREICAGDTIGFEDRTQGLVNQYVWSFPGGTPASDTVARPYVQYSQPGVYPVTLTVSGPGGSRSVTRKSLIQVNPLPQVALDASKQDLCLGEEVTLIATGQGPFLWDLGEEVPPPLTNQVTFEPTGDATYRITTPANQFGCVGQAEISLRVGQGRSLKVDPPQTVICQGESVKLQATGAQQYQWSPAQGLSTTSSGLVYASPARSTTYTVMGISPGCTTRREVRVAVEQGPVDFEVSADQPQLCVGAKTTLNASGAASFRWAPVSSLNRSDGGTVVALPRTTTRYTVTAISENGCEARKEIEVQVGSKPKLELRASQTRVCPGEEVYLSANGASSYQWRPHPTLLVTGSAEARANPVEETRYMVVGSSLGGCTDTAFVDIAVIQGEPIEAVASRESVCPGERVVLNAVGGQNFIWGPPGVYERIDGSRATAVVNRDQTFTVSAIGEEGCRSEAQVSVTVAEGFDSPPIADFTVEKKTTCAGQEIQFTSRSIDAVQYSWEFQGGEPSTSLEANPKVKFFDEGLHDVKLTVRGCGGQQATREMPGLIFVTAPFELSLNTTDGVVCEGGSLELRASGGRSYRWSPAQGLDQTRGPVVNASPDKPTVYTVVATDASGCQAREQVRLRPIEANPERPVSVSPFAPTICQGESVTLQAQGGAAYSWQPTESLNQSFGSVVQASPQQTTTYTARISTLDGCSYQRQVTVTVRDTIPLNLLPVSPTICAGEAVDLRVGAEGVFEWSPAYGLSTTKGRRVQAYPQETTAYTVRGTDRNGCTTAGKVTVNVRQSPKLEVSATDATICRGTTTELTVRGDGPFRWSPASVLIDTVGRVVTAAPTTTTTYTVQAGRGQCQSKATVTVGVLEPKPLAITPESPAVCPGQPVELTATNGSRHAWSGPNLNTTYGKQVWARPDQTARYVVVGKDEQGCDAKGAVSVKVGEGDFLEVASSVSSACEGDEIQLQASGAASYRWIAGDVSTASNARVYAQPTEPSAYRVIGTNAQGCTDTAEIQINVRRLDVQFLMSTDRLDLADGLGVVDFTDKTDGALQWTWDFGEGGKSSSADPTHIYDQVGTYEVVLRASDGVCTGIARQKLTVENSSSLEALQDEGYLSVTPVTSTGLVDLALESPRDMYLKLRLLNDQGVQIVDATLRLRGGPYKQQLNLSSFPKGTYHLQLLDGVEYITRQIRYE